MEPDIIQSLISFNLSVIFLLIAILLVRKGSRTDGTTVSLSLHSALLFLWTLSQAIVLGNRLNLKNTFHLNQQLIIFLPLVGLSFHSLTTRFLRIKGYRLVWWVIGLSIVSVFSVIDLWQPQWSLPWEITLSRIIIGFSAIIWGFITIRTILVLKREYRIKQQPLHRNRNAYWAITLLATIIGEMMFLIQSPNIGNISLFLGVLLATFIISTHRQPDIRLGSLRIISYLITTTIFVVIYTLLYMTTQFIFQIQLGTSPLFAGIIMALLLAIFIKPVLTQIQYNIFMVFGWVDLDRGNFIRQYSLAISNILNLDELATMAVGLIRDTLGSRQGILFLVDKVNADREFPEYRLVQVPVGTGSVPSHTISLESPITQFFTQKHQPLIQYDIDFLDNFQNATHEEKEWFSSLGMDVYVPIYSKGNWLGLLAIGPKSTGNPYSRKDLELLSTLADQTSIALENARLVEGLFRVNKELEIAYKSLNKTKDELERLDHAKSDFISIASHELRTPLTVIQGYSQMLKGDPSITENAYYHKLIVGIENGAERLQEIVDDMLDVAKIDNQELDLSPAPIPIATILQNITENLFPTIHKRNITLELADLSGLLPIEADRDAIRKVFYHLIINAIKYTPTNGKIQINGHMIKEGDKDFAEGAIEVVISDTGVGIDPDNLELVFRKFYRTGELGLHSSGKTKFMGAGPGLGLAIAKGVVQAHGGKIWAESLGYDPERFPGSKFHVILPLRQN